MVMLAVYLIPHSIHGSQLDWEQMVVETGRQPVGGSRSATHEPAPDEPAPDEGERAETGSAADLQGPRPPGDDQGIVKGRSNSAK